jgi:hypothetical protein
MKSPKEEAQEIVNEFMSNVKMPKPIFGLTTSEAKQCAHIHVDLTINMLKNAADLNMLYRSELTVHYQQIKNEINNL